MLRLFRSVRRGERPDVWAAFAMLFGLISSHSVLEAARDALFLSKLPAERLPVVYLAIAAVSLAVTQLQQRYGSRLNRRVALSAWTLTAAVVTFSFYLLLPALGAFGLYALYVWSGVLTTLVLVHFWTLNGDIFSVTQAKRVYGVIGAGSVLGAIVGSALATAAARSLEPRVLVLISAGGFLLTAVAPRFMRDPGAGTGTSTDGSPRRDSMADAVAFLFQNAYARRVAALVVVSTGTLTVADFLFKQIVARSIPPEQLGSFFASFYLVLNLLSLISQLGLVTFLLQRFSITAALAVLPALLLLGSIGLLASGGLLAALIVKGADGALKHSLNRTSVELLFVPMSDAARRRVKAFIDVAGQRGGQTVASLGILGLTALGLGPEVLAVVLVLLAIFWLIGTLDLRRHYLEVFRRRLRRGSGLEDFPELDLVSLENIFASLDSEEEGEVMAALHILEREDRVRLVPGLIVFHPSDGVVIHALELFIQAERRSVAPLCDRLVKLHPSPQVRAAALAARSVLDPDEKQLRLLLSTDESPEVRATIMVNLIAMGAIVGSDAKDALAAVLNFGTVPARVALANSIARRRSEGFEDTLIALSRMLDPEVRSAAARAMGALKADVFLPVLIELLANEQTRGEAQKQLIGYGLRGLRAAETALSSQEAPAAVRWELPRLLSQFEDQSAASQALVSQLPVESDGMVRYRTIRALETMLRQQPNLALDHATLDRAIDDTLSRAYRYLDRLITLRRGVRAQPERDTMGHRLLSQSLQDKERHAVGRLFNLLALRYPNEEFGEIHEGLRSDDAQLRASSVELVENILSPPLRGAVVGLIDEADDDERLQAAGGWHAPMRLDYEALLEHMLLSSSRAVQNMTIYHIGELKLRAFTARIASLRQHELLRSDIDRTLAILQAEPDATEGSP